MINTSYFAKYKGDNGVAITRYKPKWWKGEWMPSLAPSPELLNWWKTLSKEEQRATGYIAEYVQRFLKELKAIEPTIPELAKSLQGKVLLCYENLETDFCHREVVAQLFEIYGFECKELDYEYKEN